MSAESRSERHANGALGRAIGRDLRRMQAIARDLNRGIRDMLELICANSLEYGTRRGALR